MWREAKHARDARANYAKAALKDTLHGFDSFGSALLEAHEDQVSPIDAVQNAGGWLSLRELVATAAQLTNILAVDPLAHGYHHFRLYALRMLRALES